MTRSHGCMLIFKSDDPHERKAVGIDLTHSKLAGTSKRGFSEVGDYVCTYLMHSLAQSAQITFNNYNVSL